MGEFHRTDIKQNKPDTKKHILCEWFFLYEIQEQANEPALREARLEVLSGWLEWQEGCRVGDTLHLDLGRSYMAPDMYIDIHWVMQLVSVLDCMYFKPQFKKKWETWDISIKSNRTCLYSILNKMSVERHLWSNQEIAILTSYYLMLSDYYVLYILMVLQAILFMLLSVRIHAEGWHDMIFGLCFKTT